MEATSVLPAGIAESFGPPSPWVFMGPFAGPQPQEIFDDALRHHRAGRLGQAITRYKRALSLRPDYADAHNNLGVALAAQGRVIDAIAHYRRAIGINPDHGNAHSNLGTALASLSRFEEAIPHYERALELSPRVPENQYNLAIALAAQGRPGDAIARYQQALFLKHDYAEAHNNLGNLLAAQGKAEEAISHYLSALAVNPHHAGALNNLGNTYRDLGRFDEAMEQYDRAIAIRPVSAEAHYNRAELKTFLAGDKDLDALESLARRTDLPVSKSPFIHFALAKALEDTGDFARSFNHLRRGNDAKRAQVHYDERRTAEGFRRVARAFDRGLFERLSGHGCASAAPVFIVGMPRSGSTLIEQILASHPQVHGAGELPDLAACLPAGFPESMADLEPAALRDIGEAYVSRLLGRVPASREGIIRVVDKAPDNFFRIGLIRLALPNARIIHSVRHPIDTCISCYSKLFTNGQNFSYDLGELGRYYRRYSELMTHWQSVLPEAAMLEVAYEDVVEDLEGQARRLVDYCGLPWDERCLAFHKTSRVVRTASAVQVRRPLFRSSLQRWRRYEHSLIPLLREVACGAAA